MTELRRARERGHENHGWLDSWHTFSFADYYDAEHMGFGPLRVINEDRIQAGSGFGTHGHRDMEIVTYVLEGAIAHKDSIGTGSTIVPGDVQRMSAGTGVRHSEYNAHNGVTHFLQIWIQPDVAGIQPSYEQKHFSADEKRGRLRLIASPDGRDGSVRLQQDALIYEWVRPRLADSHSSGKRNVDPTHLFRVRTDDGREFSIGSGFTDAQRESPAPVGTVVTYRFRGLTAKGLPRFPSFLRIRRD